MPPAKKERSGIDFCVWFSKHNKIYACALVRVCVLLCALATGARASARSESALAYLSAPLFKRKKMASSSPEVSHSMKHFFFINCTFLAI